MTKHDQIYFNNGLQNESKLSWNDVRQKVDIEGHTEGAGAL